MGNLPDKLLRLCPWKQTPARDQGTLAVVRMGHSATAQDPRPITQPRASAYHGALSSLDHECPTTLGGALCHVYIPVLSVNKHVNKAPTPYLDVVKPILYSNDQRFLLSPDCVSIIDCSTVGCRPQAILHCCPGQHLLQASL